MPRGKTVHEETVIGGLDAVSLYDFIPKLSPDLAAPYHLSEYVDAIQTIPRPPKPGEEAKGVRICIACPPQCGKTTTTQHLIVWLLRRFPEMKIAYASHSQSFSDQISRICRDLFLLSGGQIKDDFNTIKEWQCPEGGGFYSTSWEASLIGRRVDLLVCDDLIKDAKMADSSEQREHILRWFDSVATQRLWVGGSVIVIGSRWHPDDPSGKLIARGYREICIPAVSEVNGIERSIWPDVKPLAFFDALRLPSSPDYIGEHAWNAAYMGKPVPREGTLFSRTQYVDSLPEGAQPVCIGFDLATTATKQSDYSSAVVLWELRGIYYVGDVRRKRQVIGDIEVMLHELQAQYPGVPIASYVGGQERAIYDLLFYRGCEVHRLPARTSKWARSQRTGIAWKAGRVVVLRGKEWTKQFVREVEFFTGQEDSLHDDQVDALVGAYDFIAMQAPVGWASGGFTFGRPSF